MSERNNNVDRLKQDFPRLFRGQTISLSCSNGWFDLVYNLMSDIEKEVERLGRPDEDWPQISQIKEKFGVLRVYIHNITPEIRQMIDTAEQKSAITCYQCGAPGSLRGHGWVITLCDKCDAEKRQREEESLRKREEIEKEIENRKRQKYPILFLDFDGVLHPDEAYYSPKRGVHLRLKGHELFEYAAVLTDVLSDYPNIKIVLSTSWVRILSFEKAKSYLPPMLQLRVVGATWHSEMNQDRWLRLNRCQQIGQYINRHGLKDWLAVDDDVESWPEDQKHRLVQTDRLLGLSQKQVLTDLKSKLKKCEGAR